MKNKTDRTETTKATPPGAAVALAILPSLEKQTIRQVPLTTISPSPFQPRKDFDPEELANLRESIQAHGIQIPLLGRYRDNDTDGVELIAGERRFRCAKELKLESVPMIVRANLTDEEVIRIQRVENAGRENLKALEAAEDYVLLQSQGKTMEEICTLHGVKRSHVFTRMRVAKLAPEFKQLIKDGKLSITVADLIAKLPTLALQKEVVEVAIEPDWQDELPSFRDIKAIIDDDYTRNLKDAPWIGKVGADLDLVKDVGPCVDCPKRSGNIEGAEGSPHVCTDVDCYKKKVTAHATRVIADAVAQGTPVVAASEYQKKSYNYELTSEVCYRDQKNRTFGTLAKAANVTPAVTVNRDGEAIEVITPADKEKIFKAHKLTATDSYTPPKPSKEQLERQEKFKLEKVAIQEARRAAMLAATNELDLDGKKPVPLRLWQNLANTMLQREADMSSGVSEEWMTGRGLKWTGEEADDRKALLDYINRQVTPHNLIWFILQLLLEDVTTSDPGLLEIWGVDWKQYLPGAKPAAQSPAKKAKGTKAKPAKTQKPTKGKTTKATAAVKAAKKGGRK